MASIYRHLKRTLAVDIGAVLKDPRRCAGRWNFSLLLKHSVQGMLCGCKNLRELELLTAGVGKRIPDTTMHDLLVQIDAEPLKQEIARGVKAASRSHELDERELPIRLVVIDGKCVSTTSYPVDKDSIRRSQKGREKYVHMFLRAFYAPSPLKLLLGQKRVPKGTNERGAFADFLEELVSLYGRTQLLEVLSLDAGITSIKNAALIRERGLHYVMALKDPRSRKATRAAIELLGHKQTPDVCESERVNGKQITRRLFRCAAPPLRGWEHATELWRIAKETVDAAGKSTLEDRYFITSIPARRLSNKQVLKVVRAHWSIENNANWVCDTAWKEDSHPWCNKALELLTLLRILAYNAVARFKFRRFRKAKTTSIPWAALLDMIRRTLYPITTISLAGESSR